MSRNIFEMKKDFKNDKEFLDVDKVNGEFLDED